MSGYFRRDDDLEEYLELYNDEFALEEEVHSGLAQVFDFINTCNFPSNSRIWQKADLFTLIVELYRLVVDEGQILPPSEVADLMVRFYDEVESVTRAPTSSPDVAEYYRRVRSGINDRNSRINRGAVVRERLLAVLRTA
jgi:hypothetical protein